MKGARAGELAFLIALTWFAIVATAASCAWFSHQEQIVKDSVVDCTKGELPSLVARFAPILEALFVRSTTGDGKTDWSAIEEATKGLGADEGLCIVGSVVQKELHPPPPKPGAPASSPLPVDSTDLSLHFEDMRAKRFGGKTAITKYGKL